MGTSEAIASNTEGEEEMPTRTKFEDDPNTQPTLKDLERYKPTFRPEGDSPQYARAYRDLMDRLCNSFKKQQLRQFCIDYETPGVYIGKGRKKVDYAQLIMEKHWGWESLKEIERRRRDRTEVISKGKIFFALLMMNRP